MLLGNHLYRALNIDPNANKEIRKAAQKLSLHTEDLKFYNNENILPDEKTLELIEEKFGVSKIKLKIEMGIFDSSLLETLRNQSDKISDYQTKKGQRKTKKSKKPPRIFETEYGELYEGDCLNLLPHITSSSIDLVFADPPFNLDKTYPSGMDDNIDDSKYIGWCKKWLDECVRVLKPGGSLFLWNLPKWNTALSGYLNNFLNFRHWIATDIKYTLPIPKRLYPAHYSLLYYVKGKSPNTFNPDRLPMEICDNCYKELKDYGGYKQNMNPAGINLTDVWYDISPVRHSKYKSRKNSNELSIKLLDRIIQMASEEGDMILDPFGGAGTTYIVSELKKRNWIGIELGPSEVIIERFKKLDDEKKYLKDYRKNYNYLFPPEVLERRKELNLWTPESVRKKTS